MSGKIQISRNVKEWKELYEYFNELNLEILGLPKEQAKLILDLIENGEVRQDKTGELQKSISQLCDAVKDKVKVVNNCGHLSTFWCPTFGGNLEGASVLLKGILETIQKTSGGVNLLTSGGDNYDPENCDHWIEFFKLGVLS